MLATRLWISLLRRIRISGAPVVKASRAAFDKFNEDEGRLGELEWLE